MEEIPLLVASCDRYSDLWKSFFTVFRRRWPDCPYPLYLGTNRASCPEEGVTSLAVGEDPGWAAGVRRMLDRLGTSHVILFLEDFLIKEKVDTEAVGRLVGIARDGKLGSLRLSPLPPPTPLPSRPLPGFPDVGIVEAGTPYRVSTQPAVWRTETLRSLLLPGFSAWDFEHTGSLLSERMPDVFCGPYRPFLVYDHGVEKGKWKPEGIAICRAAGVEPDLLARPAFTPEELAAHYERGARENRLTQVKQNALSGFLAGRRAEGLRHALRFVRERPFSLQGWGILAFGLMGPRPLSWLRNAHLDRKLAGLRKASGRIGHEAHVRH